jgi:hypothetical protein
VTEQTTERTTFDTLELWARGLMPLVLACATGYFVGQGQWGVAWRLAVLWLLTLIFNAVADEVA